MIKSAIAFLIGIAVAISLYGQSSKQMAITIDDLPMNALEQDDVELLQMNLDLLAHLSEYEVPAIGFVNERKLYNDNGAIVPIRRQILVEWMEAGLELGNHTYSHPDYNSLEPEQFFEEIVKGEEITRALMSADQKELKYFRHPYLHRGDTREKVEALEDFLSEKGYTEAPVTIDNSEWIFARAYELALQAEDQLMADRIGNSYIAYMMDKTAFFERNARALFARPISQTLLIHDNFLNAHFLGKLLAALQSDGYEFISLAEALEDPAYSSQDKMVTRGGITWLHRWAVIQGVDKSFFAGEPSCPQFVQEYAGIVE